MTKTKHLSKRQLDVIEDLFVGELTEQCILDKYKVGRHLYSIWLMDELFAEHLDRRIAASYRQSACNLTVKIQQRHPRDRQMALLLP